MVNRKNSKLFDMVLASVFIAIVAISTRFGVNFTGTQGGYSHFGNVPLIAIAIIFGKKHGALAGGLGMAIFDLFSEYAAWAPYTFVVRLAMGYAIGYIAWINNKKGNSMFLNIVAVLVGSVIMMGGYFISEYFIAGNWVMPVQSIPGNVLQLVVGILGGLPLAITLKRNKVISRYIDSANN